MSGKKARAERRQQQEKRVCIFCGGHPLTEEHFWPQWIRSVAPTVNQNHHDRIIDLNDLYGSPSPNYITNRKLTGPPYSATHKVVCGVCNSQWMSRLEDEAKPILSSLMLGEPIILDETKQSIVNKWVFLKAIIGEFNLREKMAISLEDRKSFYETKEIPEEWQIWIAKLDKTYWGYNYIQTSMESDYTTTRTFRKIKQSSKSGLLINGELVLYLAKFPLKEFQNTRGNLLYGFVTEVGLKMYKMHPNNFDIIDWNTLPTITLSEAHSLYYNHREFAKLFNSLSNDS